MLNISTLDMNFKITSLKLQPVANELNIDRRVGSAIRFPNDRPNLAASIFLAILFANVFSDTEPVR